MTLQFNFDGNAAFHFVFREQHLGDDIFYPHFFSSIHPALLQKVAPQIMQKINSTERKNETNIRSLLEELGANIQDERFKSVFYPEYLLDEEGKIGQYTFNKYMDALHTNNWKNDTPYSLDNNHIEFAAFSSVFYAYQLSKEKWLNNSFIPISRKEFERKISSENVAKVYTNLFSKNNSYLHYKIGDGSTALLINELNRVVLVFQNK